MPKWITWDEGLPPALAVPHLEREIREIRRLSLSLKWDSWTSETYQDEVISLLLRTHSHPGGIVEIGVYNGGLTVQLAHVCNKINKALYSLDIDAASIKRATEHMEKQKINPSNTLLHTGTIDDFTVEHSLDIPPAVVIIDALHAYFPVRHDLAKALSCWPAAPVIVLHDYPLSYNPEYVTSRKPLGYVPDVKNPVLHICGASAPLVPMGVRSKRGELCWGDLKSDLPDPNISTWLRPGEPEGVAILTQLMDADVFMRAFLYSASGSNNCAAPSPADKSIHPVNDTAHAFSSQEWRDFYHAFDPVEDLSESRLKIICTNHGKALSLRIALLAGTQEHVLEKWFHVPPGKNAFLAKASGLDVLTGEPDATTVSMLYFGGTLHEEGVSASISIITPAGVEIPLALNVNG